VPARLLRAVAHARGQFETGTISTGWLKEYKWTSVKNLNPYTDIDSELNFNVEKAKFKIIYKYFGLALGAFLAGIVIGK
jgi:hypothetical protein